MTLHELSSCASCPVTSQRESEHDTFVARFTEGHYIGYLADKKNINAGLNTDNRPHFGRSLKMRNQN